MFVQLDAFKEGFTFRNEEAGMRLSVSFGECFHDTVNLLCLSWKADIHQEPAQRYIQRIMAEVEAGQIRAQRLCVIFISTKTSSMYAAHFYRER